MLIYELLQAEQKKFKNYINKNLKKGYIRPSILFAGYLIIFAIKKNGILRLYINYR
jgi:hypothetical protein